VRIVEVDPRDDAQFARWYAVLDAVEQDTRPGESGWTPQDQREMAIAGSDPATAVAELITLVLAVDDDGRDVAMGRLVLTLHDNLDRARVLVHVLPGERRRGVGTAVLDDLQARARAAGRTVLGTEVDEPPALVGSSPAREFLVRHGFDEALLEVRRDLALPVPADVLASAVAEARERSADYDVAAYSRRCPDHLVEPRAALGRAMSVMFPSGDLDLEEEAWDAARVRGAEALFDRMGRVYFAAMALRDGEAVAFTELGVSGHQPDRAYQWDTLVLPEHRGRRLGLLLKATVLERLQADSPATRMVTTWNAEVNAPMIAVNERLGFRPNGTLSTWQKRL
jgi:GNAT superfamily N-acetyltransferase